MIPTAPQPTPKEKEEQLYAAAWKLYRISRKDLLLMAGVELLEEKYTPDGIVWTIDRKLLLSWNSIERRFVVPDITT